MTMVKVGSRQGFTQITLDNGLTRIAVLPELGGKIISLVRVASGREYLVSLPTGTDFRKPSFGRIFVDYNNVGFDECIPTIAACTYPDGSFAGTQLPDHGDVWSVPWQHEVCGTSLLLSVEGRSLPYIFSKRLSLEGAALKIEYELQNKSSVVFHYLWSAHPLLNTEPGATILLPLDSGTLLIDSSKGVRLGSKGESCTWPVATQKDGKADDLRLMKSRGDASDKLYTPRLDKGYCGLHYPSTNESILFKFDVTTAPYVGMWICHAGSGLFNPKEPYTIALEPCNGRPDSLLEATARRENTTLLSHERKQWDLRLELLEGMPKL
jgi:galactose mutarotase-like enzyme